jgi:hypothetical protein
MSDTVQFGLNTFQRPAGASPSQGWDTAQWLKQTRARRQQLHGEHTVNGQEVTPQHQRQQLLAQVERAQRAELVALFKQVMSRDVALEEAFNASELPSGAKDISKLRPLFTEQEMRMRLMEAIRSAQPAEFDALFVAATSIQGNRSAGPAPAPQYEDPSPSR